MPTIEQGIDRLKCALIREDDDWNVDYIKEGIAALLDAQREIKVRDEAMKWHIKVGRRNCSRCREMADREYQCCLIRSPNECDEIRTATALDAARKKVDDGS